MSENSLFEGYTKAGFNQEKIIDTIIFLNFKSYNK
jgi:hypothetical protein